MEEGIDMQQKKGTEMSSGQGAEMDCGHGVQRCMQIGTVKEGVQKLDVYRGKGGSEMICGQWGAKVLDILFTVISKNKITSFWVIMIKG